VAERGSAWQEAQAAERGYWYPGGCSELAARRRIERETQGWYAGLLRLADAQPTSILEIGAGPQGLLTRYGAGARKVAVEPLALTFADVDGYARAGATLCQMPIERWHALNRGEHFQEVWMTNVLQHVIHPGLVLWIAAAHALERIRIFEWVDEPVSIVHLHSLRSAEIDEGLHPFRAVHRTEGIDESASHRQAFVAGVYERSA
ncbi:MAG TPA: hypothetical protein VN607_08585, partial [Gemmatimonadaceae bacterium]|nr:hypothetical protein [Gemmatimonadaceae bacterium]